MIAAAVLRVVVELSYWSGDRAVIYTDRLEEQADGTLAWRHELGGSVGGIGMVQGFAPSLTRTSHRPLYWDGGCVFQTPDAAGSSHIEGDAELDVIAHAQEVWNEGVAACSYMRLMLEPPVAGLKVGRDGRNAVIFVEKDWCPKHKNAEGCEKQTALTQIWYSDSPGEPTDGRIIEADLELNGEHFAMATGCETECQTLGTQSTVQDLENTLVHELGHVLGLSHPCWLDERERDLKDEDGSPVPRCYTAAAQSPKITEATMFPAQAPREVSKRSLELDDVSGICAAYPTASDPAVCEPAELGQGCAVAARRSPGWALVVAAAIVLLAVRRRGRVQHGVSHDHG